MRLFGSRNPFATCDGDKVDFYGVVTFEVNQPDIGGMECTNSLLHGFSRLVFEAKTLRKKAFKTLEDFFAHYELEQQPDSNLHYVPTLNRSENKIEVRTVWQTMQQLEQTKNPVQERQLPQQPMADKAEQRLATEENEIDAALDLSGSSLGELEEFEFPQAAKHKSVMC